MVRRQVPLSPRHASPVHRLAYILRAVSDRGWGVLVLGGLISLGRGWSYFGPTSPDRTPAQLVFLERLLPIGVYGFLWMLVGVACIAVVVAGQIPRAWEWSSRFLPYALGAVVFLNGIWFLSFMIAEVQGVPRAYVSGLSYLGLAVGAFLVGKMRSVEETRP